MAEITRVVWPGWETVRAIGQGSYGTVYEVQRNVFGEVEKAAVKVISIPKSTGELEELYSDGYDKESITLTFQEHLKNIVAEYSLMRKMNGCSNVVSCDDIRYVQQDNGIGWDIYIKMELLTALSKTLPETIPEEMVRRVARDICSALVLCKQHNIIHRDIKPQNIFVSPNGDYKLGDFGIAKTVEKTTGGTRIGTYRYIAPEVFHSKPYGAAADIYSLGMVLYWLLNERRMPFVPLPPGKANAEADELARKRRLSGEPLPPPAHGSEELKAIVLKACAFDPANRFTSAAQMLQALQRLEDDSKIWGAAPVQTQGSSFEEIDQTVLLQEEAKQVQTVQPQRIQTVQSQSWQPQSVTTPRNVRIMTPPPRKKKSRAWILWLIAGVILVGVVGAILMLQPPKDGWNERDGYKYYYNNGEAITGWRLIDGYKYYFSSTGKMSTGWTTIGGDRYYFGDNGVAQTGWLKIAGNRYYLGALGAAYTGWQKIDENWYYFRSNGLMNTGWDTINGNRYYFGTDGVRRIGWQTIGENKYYFGDNGVMRTGYQTINGQIYYFDENGVLQ